MKFDFRDCTFKDVDFILELKTLGMKWYIEKLYGWDINIQKQKTMEELYGHINDTKIITLNGQDIGVTTFIEYDDYYEVGLIAIHPNFQNMGIATCIINQYINTARLNGKRIIIKTYKENPAQNLYLRLGFKVYKTDDTHLYFEIVFK